MVHDVEARKFWRIGIIRKLLKSHDGQIREVLVKVVLKNKHMGDRTKLKVLEKNNYAEEGNLPPLPVRTGGRGI